MGRETMTTPTKEQIEKVAVALFDKLQNDFGMPENAGQFSTCMGSTQNFYRTMAETAIVAWEKIRNSPK